MYPPTIFGLEEFRPHGNRGAFTFSISVQKEFAVRCSKIEISSITRDRFNQMGSQIILDVLGQRYNSPYQFAGDSLLVTQCHLGSEGRWLAAHSDSQRLLREDLHLEYTGHNIDNAEQAYTLLSLLTCWAQYAGTLL